MPKMGGVWGWMDLPKWLRASFCKVFWIYGQGCEFKSTDSGCSEILTAIVGKQHKLVSGTVTQGTVQFGKIFFRCYHPLALLLAKPFTADKTELACWSCLLGVRSDPGQANPTKDSSQWPWLDSDSVQCHVCTQTQALIGLTVQSMAQYHFKSLHSSIFVGFIPG